MPRNVFLSILGTGKYSETKYYFDKDIKDTTKYFETRFIQEATIKYFCSEWNENDRIIIFLTQDARAKNWEEPSQNGYKGLSKTIEDLKLAAKMITIDIPDGKNEDEIWKIFDKIYDVLQDEDNLYIDITHAFRSLPMLLTVLLSYAKVLKRVKVMSLTYGNWEAKDTNNCSPVIDLTALSSLQDWSIAANNFVSFGNPDMLSELTSQEINPILKHTQGKDRVASQLRTVTSNIKTFVTNLLTLRGNKIYKGDNAEIIKNAITEAKQINVLLPQLNPLLDNIQQKISSFNSKASILNIWAATEWYIQHGLYQQAYSILREGVITYICSLLNWPINDINNRELIVSACKIVKEKVPENHWKENCKNNRDKVLEIIDFLYSRQNLVENILALSEGRNDFMHAGFRDNAINGNTLIQNIDNLFKKLKEEIPE